MTFETSIIKINDIKYSKALFMQLFSTCVVHWGRKFLYIKFLHFNEGSVTEDIAYGAVSLGFDSQAVKSDMVLLVTHHCCDVFVEMCSPGAKPRR